MDIRDQITNNEERRMKKFADPHFIDFSQIGESAIGFISVTQNGHLPFEIKRSFWTYYTPENIVRGRHAHYETEQVLIAASGRIVVTTETAEGKIDVFTLNKPNQGLYIPPHVWHTMQYSHTAAQLVFASTIYSPDDYIRDYDTFKEIWGNNK